MSIDKPVVVDATRDANEVVVTDYLVLKDTAGRRLVASKSGRSFAFAASRDGVDLRPADVASLVQFLGGHPVTEEEVLARIAQQQYYDALAEKGRQFNDVLERAVHECVDEPATPGTVLFDARVLLGLDGATGARDIRAEADRG